MKTYNKMIVLPVLLFLCISAHGYSFTNWPTYMSRDQNWPSVDEYEALISDLAWCHGAIIERCKSGGITYTYNIQPVVSGTRWPWQDVTRMKHMLDNSGGLIGKFVDHTQYDQLPGMSSVPVLTREVVLNSTSSGLPSTFFGTTPRRCLGSVQAQGYPAGHGVPELKQVIGSLKYTCKRGTGTNASTRSMVGNWNESRLGLIKRWDEDTSAWHGDGRAYYIGGGGYWDTWGAGRWYWTATRTKSVPEIYYVATHVPCSISVFVKPTGTLGQPGHPVNPDHPEMRNNQLLLFEDLSSAQTSTRACTEWLGGYDGCPLADIPLENPPLNDSWTNGHMTVEMNEVYWIQKWEFRYK